MEYLNIPKVGAYKVWQKDNMPKGRQNLNKIFVVMFYNKWGCQTRMCTNLSLVAMGMDC